MIGHFFMPFDYFTTDLGSNKATVITTNNCTIITTFNPRQ